MSDYSLEPPISEELSDYPSPLLVSPSSPILHREFVETFAIHLRREFHYDSVPFKATETTFSSDYAPYEAYLFHELARDLIEIDQPTRQRCIGACEFRRMDSSDATTGWSLQWVWFHPYFRRRGHLSSVWSQFKEKYGEFHVQIPLSAAMEKFIEKQLRSTS